MSTLSFPTLSRAVPTTFLFSLVPNTQTFTSPLNKTTQTSELPGARWQFTLTWQNLSQSDSRILAAWIRKLTGAAGRFYMWDMQHPTPSGTAAGTGLVKGGSQTGRTLLTDGWTANQSGLFLPGDYVGVNGELKCITATIAADSGGNATLQFEPPLRSSPADNAPLTITKPTCVMRLVDDNQDQFEYREGNLTSPTVSGIEVF
jgi:hypothetical protein